MMERLVVHLEAAGRVRFTVCSLEDEGPIGERLRSRGVDVIALGHRGAAAQVLGGAFAIRRMLRRGGFDLVHSVLYRSHCASRLARIGLRPGVPLISAEHCMGDNRGMAARLVNRLTVRLSDRMLAVSRAVGERAAVRDGMPRDRIAVVPNGIETVEPDARSRARLRRVLRIGARETLFLYLGRLHREKGPDLLVEGLRELGRRLLSGWRCVVVGDGPERGALRAALEAAGMTERVTLMGARRRVGPWLEACDVLVMPSREEGMPVAALEAMMHGRAVVATRVGGTPEVVRAGETGLLVEPEDRNGLVAALETLARDAQFRERLGARGRMVARAEFTLEVMAEGTLREYRSLLATVDAAAGSAATAAGAARGR
jgi:glycosyltransferase involved in cell wall biosynthesis